MHWILPDINTLIVFLEHEHLQYLLSCESILSIFIGLLSPDTHFVQAVYLAQDDDFFTAMGKLCELFDRPSNRELPKGIRLNTVKTCLPQIVNYSKITTDSHGLYFSHLRLQSYFNLSHLTRAPTMGDPDSSFDICFYYSRDNPDEDGQDLSLVTPPSGSSVTANATFFGDVFKPSDESYISLLASHFPR